MSHPLQLRRVWRDHQWQTALVGEIKRTKAPALMFDPARGVVLRYLTKDDLRGSHEVSEATTRHPIRRFKKLAKLRGSTKAARAFINNQLGGGANA